VYHLELREFPKRVHRFNLSGQEIGAIVLLWVQDRAFEMAENTWSPRHGEITIVEGPEIPVAGMSLGRGWSTAERDGEDVTERILAEARQAVASGDADGAVAPGAAAELLPDAGMAAPDAPAAGAIDPLTLGVELASLLGAEPSRLLAAWRGVARRAPTLSPSESLALAERELASAVPADDR
jgi:hypothetical protein